jgi:hypothetical protein
MTKVRKIEFSGLLSPQEFNSGKVRMWAKSERYKVVGGCIYPEGIKTELTFPLSDPGLFLSFARLGARGEPSENSIQRWVSEHGLLKGEDSFWDSWPDGWPKVFPTEEESDQFTKSPIKEEEMSVVDFRTEVRFANQLLNLYADIRVQDLPAIRGRFTAPPDFPQSARQTPIDRYLENEWNSPLGGKHEVALARKGTYGRAVVLLISSLSYAVRSVRLSLTDGPLIERPPTLYRVLTCPDLLSAMYLQFYLLVTNHKPMRRCKNPACRLPFPVTRTDKWHCNDTCRSNARNYPKPQSSHES